MHSYDTIFESIKPQTNTKLAIFEESAKSALLDLQNHHTYTKLHSLSHYLDSIHVLHLKQKKKHLVCNLQSTNTAILISYI